MFQESDPDNLSVQGSRELVELEYKLAPELAPVLASNSVTNNLPNRSRNGRPNSTRFVDCRKLVLAAEGVGFGGDYDHG